MTNNSQAIPLTLNSRSLLIVPLPDGAKNVIIDIEGRISCITKTDYLGGEILKIDLPPGTYHLLFLSSQATEEDAVDIVESYYWENATDARAWENQFDWYKNYSDEGSPFTTALESFTSLLSSLGVTNAAVLEKVNV